MRYLTMTLAFAALLAVATPARAEWYVSPFVGANFGGDTGDASASLGVAAGWMGSGILGAEGEIAYAPQLFPQDGFSTDHRLTTAMGNLTVSVPVMRTDNFRPYVLGGVGVFDAKISEAGGIFSVSEKPFGMDLGVGAVGYLNHNVGLRADVRYFRALHQEDEEAAFGLDFSKFHYWRTSVGLVFRF